MARYFSVAVCMLLGFMLSDLSRAEESLIGNPDFSVDSDGDGVPDGWPAANDNISYQKEGDKTFLRITQTESGKMPMAYKQIMLKPEHKAFKVTYRIRAKDLKVGKDIWNDGRIIIDFKDEEGKKLKSGAKHPNAKGTTDWIERSITFAVPEGAVKLEFLPCLMHAESGSFDVGLLRVEVIDPSQVEKPVDRGPSGSQRDALAEYKDGPPPLELRVVGNKVLNSKDEEVWLQGLAIASLEWMEEGDGVLYSAQVGIDSWKANALRIAVKHDYWFGRAKSQKGGAEAYRERIDNLVRLISGRGAYMILDLHVYRAPLQEHLEFWQDAATRYKNNPAVLFDVINEPHDITWEVWRDGGIAKVQKKADVAAENNAVITEIQTIGMQALIDGIRATGAKNIIIAGGLDWAYDLSGILKGYALTDKTGNGIMYSTHVYPWKSNWQEKFIDIAAHHPIFMGEVGCMDKKMPWESKLVDPYTWAPDMLGVIQKHKLHWTAWCFHTSASPCVISDWKYTPTPYWGQFVWDALVNGKQFEVKKLR